MAKELKNIGSKLVNLKKKNDVAILYSHDSYYGLRFMPYTHGDNYPVEMLHSSLYNMNIETDIVHCDKVSDFSEYKMLIIPPLYIATDELLEKIDAARAQEYMTISGITMFEPAEATEVKAVDENELKLKQLKKLLAALEENEMTPHISYIDLNLVSDIVISYDERLRVNLGDGSDMEYKLRYFLKILDEIPETDSGTVTFTDSKTARFIMDL